MNGVSFIYKRQFNLILKVDKITTICYRLGLINR